MKSLAALALLASCSGMPTFEETARFLTPDRIYVERGDGRFLGPRGELYEDETWVVGLGWDILPKQVRVLPEEAPRAWYEPEPVEPAEDITITIPEETGSFVMETLLGLLTIVLGGSGYAVLRTRRRPVPDPE